MQGKETRSFQSEVQQLLHLMIHSLYSNKEIFLRELISNASDAADKLRFCALSNSDLYNNDSDLYVRISINKDNKTLTLSDNGIGMSYNEVINNLGTIAKSGTKTFIESLGSDKIKNSQLIGQFGVGFYSSFIVAEKVSVLTRTINTLDTESVLWESTGNGEYTISYSTKKNRGTEITLKLRKGEEEFLDDWRIRNIISKYSDHIGLSIEIEKKDEKDSAIIWEKINKAQALWTRNKSDISDKEYIEFYKHITHDFNDPITWSHNRVEGKQEYISLIYIPTHAPFNMWNRDSKHGLKLYVNRVFIMDDAEYFLPNYLRFAHGLIDSNDLPLNISREILQDSRVSQNLRNALTKRVLQILEKLSKNKPKYQLFWKEFGLVLKEGPAEDNSNKQIIAKLLRFATTNSNSSEQSISLDEYIARMIDGQDKIYYIATDSFVSAKNSPNLELFRNKGIEVLLLSDRIDEWMMSHLTEFNGKVFQSISKSDESLNKLSENNNDENQKKIQKEFESFINRVQKFLGERVKQVRLTYRLIDTPAIVTSDSNEITTQMAKLFTSAGQKVPELKYIFEINPEHFLIRKIADIQDETYFNEWIELLLDQALLAERNTLDDPNQFIRRVNKLLITEKII